MAHLYLIGAWLFYPGVVVMVASRLLRRYRSVVFQTAALSWAVGSALLAASVSGIAVSPWEQRFYVAVLAGCAVGGVLAAGVSRRNAGRQRWEADPDQDCTP